MTKIESTERIWNPIVGCSISFGMVEEGWEERGGAWLTKVGKKRAGRLLDGREHNDMPRPAHA